MDRRHTNWTRVGNEIGCLLLHGFSGSPLEMTPLAEALAGEGWTVSLAQLAGHGTSPQDLAGVTWHDWVASAHDAYEALRVRCPRIAILGLSMGGALGLYLAASVPPAAVVAISTPIRVRPLLARASLAASKILPFAPVVVRLPLRDPQMRRFRSPYNRIPLGSTAEVEGLLKETRRILPALRTPLLVIQGRRDWVIPRESGTEWLRLARAAPAQLLWLPRSGHVATLDQDRDLLVAEVTRFLRAHLAGGGDSIDGTTD